ncbi:MAG: polyprenyl synthetase family protein [SAR324 cluster bacterium]|nr:polyprenyl synthetase family protein [SAR324 cluster bacterium]
MADIATPPLQYTNLTLYLNSVAQCIDAALPRYLDGGEPRESLYELAADYPLRGGKRFRPALLMLCTALAGGDPQRALPSAVALELFQNFALVHDDIEDNSELRRGSPSLHRLHGVPLALNAGDLLFGLVYEVLLENEALLGAAQALEVQRRFAQAFRHTFEGQAMDIAWSQGSHIPTRDEYEKMIGKKTGWYSGRAPCEIGALIGGGDDLVAGLGTYGAKLGVGFQVRDDLLNLTADSARAVPAAFSGGYGKEHGGDIAEGKRTLIVIELLERLPATDAGRLKSILLAPPADTAQADIAWVISLAESTGALEAVQAHCGRLGREAAALLEPLPQSPQKELLRAMADYLVQERES